MPVDMNSQRVLVVGATGGIGRATSKAFADAGAIVTVAGRDQAELDRLASDLNGHAILLDITDNDGIERFFTSTEPFDHVVTAAARTKRGPVGNLPLADAVAAMDNKFWGTYRIARAAKIKDAGSLTFVSGIFAQRPTAATALQGSINAAIDALARGLALEKAPIRVNSVSPGIIDTPLWQGVPEESRKAIFESTATKLPVGHIGQAEDVAQAILLLATNRFITGTTISVSGGGCLV